MTLISVEVLKLGENQIVETRMHCFEIYSSLLSFQNSFLQIPFVLWLWIGKTIEPVRHVVWLSGQLQGQAKLPRIQAKIKNNRKHHIDEVPALIRWKWSFSSWRCLNQHNNNISNISTKRRRRANININKKNTPSPNPFKKTWDFHSLPTNNQKHLIFPHFSQLPNLCLLWISNRSPSTNDCRIACTLES